eukprot:gene5067-6169_t
MYPFQWRYLKENQELAQPLLLSAELCDSDCNVTPQHEVGLWSVDKDILNLIIQMMAFPLVQWVYTAVPDTGTCPKFKPIREEDVAVSFDPKFNAKVEEDMAQILQMETRAKYDRLVLIQELVCERDKHKIVNGMNLQLDKQQQSQVQFQIKYILAHIVDNMETWLAGDEPRPAPFTPRQQRKELLHRPGATP